VLVRHFVNLLLLLLPPTRLFAVRRALLKFGNVEVGAGVCVSGHGWIYGRGRLCFGDETWLSPGVRIYTHEEAEIVIGARCDIGHEVSFITGSHEIGAALRRAGKGTAGAIRVGDGCWIGARSVILGGVTVGAGSVVAAGSVVTADIPGNSFVAGVPAKLKRRLD
jgi:maltose O-acetyltransferase